MPEFVSVVFLFLFLSVVVVFFELVLLLQDRPGVITFSVRFSFALISACLGQDACFFLSGGRGTVGKV